MVVTRIVVNYCRCPFFSCLHLSDISNIIGHGDCSTYLKRCLHWSLCHLHSNQVEYLLETKTWNFVSH